MENVTFIEITNADGSITEHAIIDRGNGEFTSMTKAHYEAMQSAQVNYLTSPAIMESTQPDEADLTEGTN